MAMSKARIITRTVLVLSFVSMANDIASEMLYPIMPIYLKQIGFSVLLIGILEGVAEAVAGISKGYFGKLSDMKGSRLPFVRLGYAMSAIAKPMVVFFANVPWVFTARSLDKVGKGVRTAARDALLSDEATPATKGKVFNFHRAMDTLGAVMGPLVALIYLYYRPNHLRDLFFIAFVPSMLVIALLFLLKEKQHEPNKSTKGYSFFSFLHYLKESTPEYRKLFIGLVAFALFNSSDMFILLMAKSTGLSDAQVLGIYIAYNLVFAIASYPLGSLGDKIGLKTVFLGGLMLFSVVYAGLAFNTNFYIYLLLIFLYGIYAAATDGISKAWITNIAHKKDTATAVGTYTAFASLGSMVSSALAGFIWYRFGPTAMFCTSAVGVALVTVYLGFTNDDLRGTIEE